MSDPCFQDATIDSKRRLTLPSRVIGHYDLSRLLVSGATLQIDLIDFGLAELTPISEPLDRSGLGEAERQALNFIQPIVKMETASRLTLPRHVCTHLLGPGQISGSIFVAAPFGEPLQFWNDARRLERLAQARSDFLG